MPDAFSNDPSRQSLLIERPNCPDCRTRMSLESITRGPKDRDSGTFECLGCRHATATAETDFDGRDRRVAMRCGDREIIGPRVWSRAADCVELSHQTR
jgi:hypothetical protein